MAVPKTAALPLGYAPKKFIFNSFSNRKDFNKNKEI